jgi:hypothetical protein
MKKRLLLEAVVVLTGIFLLSASIVWSAPVNLAKTGQTTTYKVGDDGTYEKGVASPSPRFTDVGDGTVIDRLTGLMWAKDANMGGLMLWRDAINYANNLSLGTSCGTPRTDWRLPNRNELNSLIDASNFRPALPSGHPFMGVPEVGSYWSSTTHARETNKAWFVGMSNGYVYGYFKNSAYHVWPVRDAN